MLKFKFLLWMFTQLLRRQIKNNPDCARYVVGKDLVFQIRTDAGVGRTFMIRNGSFRSVRQEGCVVNCTLMSAGGAR